MAITRDLARKLEWNLLDDGIDSYFDPVRPIQTTFIEYRAWM
jgi:hypothetical protein